MLLSNATKTNAYTKESEAKKNGSLLLNLEVINNTDGKSKSVAESPFAS
jgi:hypothetical protein